MKTNKKWFQNNAQFFLLRVKSEFCYHKNQKQLIRKAYKDDNHNYILIGLLNCQSNKFIYIFTETSQ